MEEGILVDVEDLLEGGGIVLVGGITVVPGLPLPFPMAVLRVPDST